VSTSLKQHLEISDRGVRVRSKNLGTLGADELNSILAELGWSPPPEESDARPPEILFERCTIDGLELANFDLPVPIDFYGCRFTGRVDLRGLTAAGSAKFRTAVFKELIDARGASFQGNIHFNSAVFEGLADFSKTTFGARCVFSQARFQRSVRFAEARFEGGCSFNDVVCEHRFEGQKAEYADKLVSFSVARFENVVDLSEATFHGEVRFKGTHFTRRVAFTRARFGGALILRGSTMEDEAHFRGAKFAGGIDLRSVYGERPVDFSDAELSESSALRLDSAIFGSLLLRREQIEGRIQSVVDEEYDTARREFGILKRCYHTIGEYELEDWAYYMEKRMERLSAPHGVRRVVNYVALELACGYGTRPLNVFMTAVGILFSFALFYFAFGGQFTDGPIGLAQGLQLSFRVFTNAEVDSAGPLPGSWMNPVVMLESFLGFFVMMILVVTFSRKVIR